MEARGRGKNSTPYGRLGGGQGFYGDGHLAVNDLLDAGVDYLVCEALAELTLAILPKDRPRDECPRLHTDLPLYLRAALPLILDGRTTLITTPAASTGSRRGGRSCRVRQAGRAPPA